jgi:hypothetical protein
VGSSAVSDRTNEASILVVGVLSFCEIPRKSAGKTGSADGSQRKTTTETISKKKNANDGGGDHNEAIERPGIDQLSTSVI